MKRTRRIGRLAALIVCCTLAWAGPARADAVTHWNEVAANAIAVGRPGPGGFLDLGLVQAAVYDAVQSIERRFKKYHVRIPDACGSSSVAAARASHDLLVSLYASNTTLVDSLDQAYLDYLDDNGLSAADPGADVGSAVAALYVGLYRAGTTETSPGGTGAGVWRPTNPPTNTQGFGPWVPSLTPFTLESASQFRVGPHPDLTSRRYSRDYDEVKKLGGDALTGHERTQEQTDLAIFYTTDFGRTWNRTLRGIADAHLDDISDTSRLFALANLAAADAFITVWDSKYYYNFWRPITAIREGDNDGNPHTKGNPTWTPFIATPPYPDYTSGANGVTAAYMGTLALFFGTNKFDFTVMTVPGNLTREYTRFSHVLRDVVDVRILQGIHFRFADEAGRNQGLAVAFWVFKNFLRPVHHHGHKHGDKGDKDDCDEDDHDR